jgi:hypothetical protein
MSLSLIPPTLPSDFCTLSTQEQTNLLIAGTQVTGSVEGGIVFSTDEPGVDDRDKAWGLLNPDGSYSGKIFTYDDGNWGSQHPYAVSGDVRLIWTGIEADVWSFDGGDGVDPAITAPTTFTGAMWEVDTVFAGRSPMGVGAISGSDPAKNITLGESYGQGSVTLLDDQVFSAKSHKHVFGRTWNTTGDTSLNTFGATSPPYPDAANLFGWSVGSDAESSASVQLSSATISGYYLITSEAYNSVTGEAVSLETNQPHQNVHPVVGVYLIKRTARQYYTP